MAVKTPDTKKKTKSAKAPKAEAKRVAKAELKLDYNIVSKVKEKAHELEEGNLSHIYIFASKKGWWKVGGNSALIYTRLIAPGTRKKIPVVRPDTDRYFRFKYGVVSVPNVENFIEELAKIDLKPEKIGSNGYIYAFKLKKAISEDTLLKIKHEKVVQDEMANRLVETQVIIPNLRKAISKLSQKIWSMAKNDSEKRVMRTKIISGMLEDSLKMKKVYSRMANGYFGRENGLTEILAIINDMQSDLSFLEEVNEINITVCMDIQYVSGQISSIIRTELERMKLEKKKKEEKDGTTE